ncbi:outer membrane protein assembly factor BamC [Kushneria sinocarnis]|uniref:Outer membrane protein assembly factor BamC n=1 Tax=Kushneria sinocarnis TaxID=595502 RepID=A0A420WZF2_9GAMM|nr:outer membrane protein assembly factor BamC [Kushneria sinocarnis]RKR06660.1 outer membrane protein assembly factor BamC [Kushneria sinocarnis]
MRSQYRWVMTVPLMALLAGCGGGYYYDRNAEYKDAEMAAPLELPAQRNQRAYQNAMPVPDASNDFMPSDDFEAPRPQSMSSQQSRQFVEDRQSQGQHWLVVNAAPGSIWPRLQSFVTQRGYQVTSVDGNAGRIVTDAGTLSVRQGLRNNSSEVYCQQQDAPNERCLTALARFLDQKAPEGGVSMVAQNLSRNDRVRLENSGGRWQLAVALDFPRAWSEFSYQLNNNFANDDRRLVDEDRSQRVFMVRYRRADEGGSWIPFMGGKPDLRPYRLAVEPEGDSVRMRVTDPQGETVDPKIARSLLDAVASTLR